MGVLGVSRVLDQAIGIYLHLFIYVTPELTMWLSGGSCSCLPINFPKLRVVVIFVTASDIHFCTTGVGGKV